ncbi:MAG: hypothetical protein H0U73_12445 [Tatlockia sp.]|nr:hypothetical protein [Tatlockia sp.]
MSIKPLRNLSNAKLLKDLGEAITKNRGEPSQELENLKGELIQRLSSPNSSDLEQLIFASDHE